MTRNLQAGRIILRNSNLFLEEICHPVLRLLCSWWYSSQMPVRLIGVSWVENLDQVIEMGAGVWYNVIWCFICFKMIPSLTGSVTAFTSSPSVRNHNVQRL